MNNPRHGSIELTKQFLRSPHRKEFVKMCGGKLAVAAIVYFRRSTSYKRAYMGEFVDWFDHCSPWYKLPVDPKETAKIRASTVEKYNWIIAEIEGEAKWPKS